MTAREIITARVGRDLGPLVDNQQWRNQHG